MDPIIEFLYCWTLIPRIICGVDDNGNLITKLHDNAKLVDALHYCGVSSGLLSHTILGTDKVNNFLRQHLI
jgi:hypothetical protein